MVPYTSHKVLTHHGLNPNKHKVCLNYELLFSFSFRFCAQWFVFSDFTEQSCRPETSSYWKQGVSQAQSFSDEA